MHITFFAFSNKNLVRVPRPGPISITKSCSFTQLLVIICSTTLSSIKKFWPKDLFAFIESYEDEVERYIKKIKKEITN